MPLNLATSTAGPPVKVGPATGGDYAGLVLLAFTSYSRILFVLNANNH